MDRANFVWCWNGIGNGLLPTELLRLVTRNLMKFVSRKSNVGESVIPLLSDYCTPKSVSVLHGLHFSKKFPWRGQHIMMWSWSDHLGPWRTYCDMWHMTCDMWHVTCDMWHVTCVMLTSPPAAPSLLYGLLAPLVVNLFLLRVRQHLIGLVVGAVVMVVVALIVGIMIVVSTESVSVVVGGNIREKSPWTCLQHQGSCLDETWNKFS